MSDAVIADIQRALAEATAGNAQYPTVRDDGSGDLATMIPWQKSRTALDGHEHMRRVRRSIESGHPSIMRLYDRFKGRTAVVIGGSPSIEEIVPRAPWPKDAVVFAINKSFNWCVEHGVTPDFGVICDSGDHVVEYQDPHPGSEYIYCSQVCDGLLEKIPKDRTYLFHAETVKAAFDGAGDDWKDQPVRRWLEANAKPTEWVILYPSSTTAGAMVPILNLLGFERVEFVGVESWIKGGRVHPYTKSRLDIQELYRDVVLTDETTGKTFGPFKTTLPLARQFMEWRALMQMWDDNIASGYTAVKQIVAHGDGPIPWMMKQRGWHVDCAA